jgi:hypothetical protein
MNAAEVPDCCLEGPGVLLVVGVISEGEAVPSNGDVADAPRETNRLDMVDLQPALAVTFA